MDGRLILGLIWLTCVRSEGANNLPIEEASMANGISKSTPTETDESSAAVDAPLAKIKRFLSHQHSSPCPPFYPHVDMHMPMYAMRPYGPPAYPKADHHMPTHQSTQYIHQQSYSSYAPKQTIQYVKQVAPVYSHPVVVPPIQPVYKHPPPVHHVPIQPVYKHSPPVYHVPIQPVYKPSPPIHHVPIQPVYKPSPPVYYHHDKVFAYAPTYHKPAPMIWQGPQVKVEYPVHQKPAIVYKPEVPKCAPCSSGHQSQIVHQPSVSYVKVAQPIIHQVAPVQHYLPATVHQPVAKPCDK